MSAANELFGAPGGVDRACQLPAGLLHGKVGFTHGHEGVIRGGLTVGLAGFHLLPCGQWCEDRVVHVDDAGIEHPGPQANHPAAAAVVKNVALGVLIRAVMAVVVASEGQAGNPENLGLIELSRRHLNARGGRGHVDRPDIGQLQCGWQIDRQGLIVGACRRDHRRIGREIIRFGLVRGQLDPAWRRPGDGFCRRFGATRRLGPIVAND